MKDGIYFLCKSLLWQEPVFFDFRKEWDVNV